MKYIIVKIAIVESYKQCIHSYKCLITVNIIINNSFNLLSKLLYLWLENTFLLPIFKLFDHKSMFPLVIEK